jgi:hypothetical protein
MTPNAIFDEYENRMTPFRESFSKRDGIKFFTQSKDKDRLLHFLVHWHGLGIKMTEQVEVWIQSAGEGCKRIGMDELGKSLDRHASEESGHERMMESDFNFFLHLWNQVKDTKIKPSDFLASSIPDSCKDYIELHRRIFSGDQPFGQIAIEYEIEQLSLSHGSEMINNPVAVLGSEALAGLSFLRHHVHLDIAHTKFNKELMISCYAQKPDCLEFMLSTGKEALEIYGNFLQDCLRRANESEIQ